MTNPAVFMAHDTTPVAAKSPHRRRRQLQRPTTRPCGIPQLFEQHCPLLPHVMPLFVQAIVVVVVVVDVEAPSVCAPTDTVNARTANPARARTVSFFMPSSSRAPTPRASYIALRVISAFCRPRTATAATSPGRASSLLERGTRSALRGGRSRSARGRGLRPSRGCRTRRSFCRCGS